ncbi:MAG: LacI family DNA-binding transcriptional regulator [Candidatus Acidiferrales bacterium]
MPRKKASTARTSLPAERTQEPTTLKTLAGYLNLSPATVSLVLNGSPGAASIPISTRDRVTAAARKLNYRPNFLARSLRKQRSLTIGVVVPEISEGYEALVLSGIEDHLLQEGYFYVVVSHRHRPDLLDQYPRLLLGRSVEGLIAVDTPCLHELPIPAVAISGHQNVAGITKIVLNHRRAACLALQHLTEHGHQRIAFIKGQEFSSDTEVRWNAIGEAARGFGLSVDRELMVQLRGDTPSPELGYHVTQELLKRGKVFTALFAFNDISAIGAIRALHEAGRRVPEDVSVVGFDDIQSAAYQNPPLTTIRQPLRKMGEIAAETLLRRIANPSDKSYPKVIAVESELVVRGSSSDAPTQDS